MKKGNAHTYTQLIKAEAQRLGFLQYKISKMGFV